MDAKLLIAGMFLPETGTRADVFGRNMRLQKSLIKIAKELDSSVADTIVGELFSRRSEFFTGPGSAFWLLLAALEEVVCHEHADRVMEMLLWPEFLEGQDRSCRTAVLGALQKVGRPEHISAIEAFGQRLEGVLYEDMYGDDFDELEGWSSWNTPAESFHEYDRYDIQKTISACHKRAA